VGEDEYAGDMPLFQAFGVEGRNTAGLTLWSGHSMW
jgi:hypothetical protein